MSCSFSSCMRCLAHALLLALSATSLRAQPPAAAVSVSFNVDTASIEVAQIVALVRAYLAQPDSTAASRGLWSTADSLDERAGDLTRFHAYHGYPATIVGVAPVSPGDSLYIVKVLHAAADSTGQNVGALALQRLYAVRATGPFGWQLSNALHRLTRDWPTRTEGRITFHYAPGQRPDSDRALRAAKFVDSVTTLFDIRSPQRLNYYVASSPDEYFRAIGLDFVALPSGRGASRGGNAIPEAGVVLAGDPAQGEAYLHELVHAVIGRRGGGVIIGEGLPTWLAGSQGRSAHEMFRLLIAYQNAHPKVTLQALARGDAGWGKAESDALTATGALFADAVYTRAGVDGLRAILTTPPGSAAALSVMRTQLALSSTDAGALDRWWRAAARAAADEREPKE